MSNAAPAKITPEQIKQMFILWLIMSGNFPAKQGEDPIANWKDMIGPHVRDIPNAKAVFTALYQSHQGPLTDASSVFRALFAGTLIEPPWNGSGDCPFGITDIIKILE